MSRRAPITAEIDERSLRELSQAIERAGAVATAAVATGVRITAEAVVAMEQLNAPVDTGAMRDGITARYSENGQVAQIGIWDPQLYYAVFLEWGTTARPAHPFATPAAERARVSFPRNVIAEVRQKVR